MSFDYDYSEKQLEEYINNNVHGKSFPQKAKVLLLSIINGQDQVELVRDWMDEYTQKGDGNE